MDREDRQKGKEKRRMNIDGNMTKSSEGGWDAPTGQKDKVESKEGGGG